MSIAVVSDSHDNVRAIERVGGEIKKRDVSLVIHAGDWVSPFAARVFREASGDVKIVGVWGNNEGERVYFLQAAQKAGVEILGDAAELEVAGRKIAVYHGTSPVLLNALIKSRQYDVVIYGHTHRAVVEKIGETLVVNPGELCGCLFGKSTYAYIDLRNLEVEIVSL